MTDLCWRKIFAKFRRTVMNSADWMPANILWKLLIMSVFFQVET